MARQRRQESYARYPYVFQVTTTRSTSKKIYLIGIPIGLMLITIFFLSRKLEQAFDVNLVYDESSVGRLIPTPLPCTKRNRNKPSDTRKPLKIRPIEQLTKIPKNCKKGLRGLKNVVLAVQYNFPYYETIPVLKQYYSQVFAKVVFCGDRYEPMLDLIETAGDWSYAYNCLSAAIMRHPHFTGYMYTNDDAILHWWHLLDYDLSKVWLGDAFIHPQGLFYELGNCVPEDWYWWTSPEHPKQPLKCAKALNKTLKFIQDAAKQDSEFDYYIHNYVANSNGRKLCYGGYSDVFYIPQKHADIFTSMVSTFEEEDVFLEIAFPTMMSFLIGYEKQNYEVLNGKHDFRRSKQSDKSRGDVSVYKHGGITHGGMLKDFVHPFKLASAKKDENMEFFQKNVLNHGQLLLGRCDVHRIN